MYFIANDLKNIKHEVVELIVSLIFTVACLLLFWLLPMEASEGRGDIVETIIRLIVIFIIFPIAYVKVILRKSLSDMYVGKFQFQLKTSLYLLLSFIIGLLGIFIVSQSFLGGYYSKLILTKYIAGSFWFFLFYELIFVAVPLFIFIFFTFGFVNFITKNFNKLNFILPVITYFLLITFSNIEEGAVKESLLMSVLSILPVLFFRKIVNVNKNIYILFLLLFILNIVFNVVIIKL